VLLFAQVTGLHETISEFVDQETVDDCPEVIVAEFAVTVTTGEAGHDGDGAVTETLFVAGKPAPEQFKVYVEAPEG